MSNLKRVRLLAGVTQQQISKELGISQAFYSYIESGKYEPSYKLQEKIKQFFHVTDEIFIK